MEIITTAEILDECGAGTTLPAIHSPLEALFSAYQKEVEKVKTIHQIVLGQDGKGSQITEAFSWFVQGNEMDDKHYGANLHSIFNLEGAIKAINASYWARAFALTDVRQYMPASEKSKWDRMLRKGVTEAEENYQDSFGHWHRRTVSHPIPAFERGTVTATLADLMLSRNEFFEQRIEGLWDSLSTEHVTNAPGAFGKRMILRRVMNYSNYLDRDMGYVIHDLRCVIAKFMGRTEPKDQATLSSLESIINDVTRGKGAGKWYVFDGGAFKIRMYKKHTAHMEIHPQMAYRLNAILAARHPMAIPPEFRVKPKAEKKIPPLVNTLLPNEVLHELDSLALERNGADFGVSYSTRHGAVLSKAAEDVLKWLGGEVERGTWYFDSPGVPEALEEILRVGTLPERRAYQFYPTPSSIVDRMLEIAELDQDDGTFQYLEPQAGQGAISLRLPKDRTTVVEISSVHSAMLQAHGYQAVLNEDFLKVSVSMQMDRILMNPPFANLRAVIHVRQAAQWLKPGGVLVAVVPAGIERRFCRDWRTPLLDDTKFKIQWGEKIVGEFEHTSVTVQLVKITRLN